MYNYVHRWSLLSTLLSFCPVTAHCRIFVYDEIDINLIQLILHSEEKSRVVLNGWTFIQVSFSSS